MHWHRIIVGVLALSATVIGASGATAPTGAVEAGPVRHSVQVAAPGDVSEGEFFTVSARLASPRRAARVEFQHQVTGAHSFESITQWTPAAAVRVLGRRTVRLRLRADTARSARFRAVVSYRGTKRTATSPSVRVDFCHWQGLPWGYSHVGSAIDDLAFSMAGRDWNGWQMYGGGSAETRYTLAGECKELKATVGLTDRSDDGATGSVVLSTIDPTATARAAWTSPVLVPGRTVAVHVRLSAPYRFSIFGQNTSAPGVDGSGHATARSAYPAFGDPEFLCHQD